MILPPSATTIELCVPLLRFSGVPMMTPGPPSAVSPANSVDRALAGGEKRRLQHQVFRRIAGDEELGEEHQVGALAGGVRPRLARLGEIAGNVADGRIELGDGDAQDVGSGLSGHGERV